MPWTDSFDMLAHVRLRSFTGPVQFQTEYKVKLRTVDFIVYNPQWVSF
jgi:hypothetical protein